MEGKKLNKWIMYHEIVRLVKLGFKTGKIAQKLNLDSRTVRKYKRMSQEEFDCFVDSLKHRSKVLYPYLEFVKSKLYAHQDTSAAQIHDWLKEHHPNMAEVSPKTVYNFVHFVRKKYDIPYQSSVRDYFPVDELPYGQQSQVDFGHFNMITAQQKRKKVYFFVMVLSRSRYKYVAFSDRPYTAQMVCLWHEQAFAFFNGIPQTIVYDQDRVMVVDENLGQIIQTRTFSQYTSSRKFNLHFCRKADPESKGKVENVVQYVKKNFLKHRTFHDLATLNDQTICWLERTANKLKHNLTKKSPQTEFAIETTQLNPYIPIAVEEKELDTYLVRKDNTINYKSNYYSIPQNTFEPGGGNYVAVKVKEEILHIYHPQQEVLICQHNLCLDAGKKIINNNHKRDTSQTLELKVTQVVAMFSDSLMAREFLDNIKAIYPRYFRDQLRAIEQMLKDSDINMVDKMLKFCQENKIYAPKDIREIMEKYKLGQNHLPQQTLCPDPMGINGEQEKANQIPEISDINEYEQLMKL